MHISDGILDIAPTAVLAVGAISFFVYSIKDLKNSDVSLISSMAALFFVASFIHIPLGPTQIHLSLIGVIGILLGRFSFLAIFIALLLQALLLGYGGLTSLGTNLIVMALPAYIVYILNKKILNFNDNVRFFAIGFLGIFFSTLILSAVLFFAKEEFRVASFTIFLGNIPTMVLEGLVTLFLLKYVKKSMPELLNK